MTEFRIQSKPLKANPQFMDIHKEKHKDYTDEDAFELFSTYSHKISVLFSDLPSEHKFWLSGTVPLRNLHELYNALDSMTDDVYKHHSTGKNDFSVWIKNVYHDDDLAMRLRHAKIRKQAKRAIEERIDTILEVGETKINDRGFLKALIGKLSRQNDKLANELSVKKEWLTKKQGEMEKWENKNIEQEKKIYDKYKHLENQEQKLYDNFHKLQQQEEALKKALSDEKMQIEEQSRELSEQQHQMFKEREHVEKQKEHIEQQKQHIEEQKKHIEHRKLDQVKHVLSIKNKHIYNRVDELLSYATACIYNNNFEEAKDTISKVKYYYGTLPAEDPHKREIYQKIITLRNQMNRMV